MTVVCVGNGRATTEMESVAVHGACTVAYQAVEVARFVGVHECALEGFALRNRAPRGVRCEGAHFVFGSGIGCLCMVL